MSQGRSTILYLFIAILVIAIIGLLIFKDEAVDSFLNYEINGPIVSVAKPGNDLNLDILRDDRVRALKSYTNFFYYDDLNKSQDLIMAADKKSSDVIISNPDIKEDNTTTKKQVLIRVRVGNTNPFVVKKEQ
jgi:hypothetical protein